jgi:PAS domain S-box-containing protein
MDSIERRIASWWALGVSVMMAAMFVFMITQEQRRVASERRLDTLLTASLIETGTAAGLVDNRSRFVFVTPGMLSLTGYSSEDLLGKSADVLCPPEHLQKHQTGFHAAMREEQEGADFQRKARVVRCRMRTKAGEEKPVAIYVFTFSEGVFVLVFPDKAGAAASGASLPGGGSG